MTFLIVFVQDPQNNTTVVLFFLVSSVWVKRRSGKPSLCLEAGTSWSPTFGDIHVS